MSSGGARDIEQAFDDDEEVDDFPPPRNPPNVKASVIKVCASAIGGSALGAALGFGKFFAHLRKNVRYTYIRDVLNPKRNPLQAVTSSTTHGTGVLQCASTVSGHILEFHEIVLLLYPYAFRSRRGCARRVEVCCSGVGICSQGT